MHRTVLFTLLAAACLLPAPKAKAQCIGPDGLSGSCCTPATANLPPLPQAALPGLGICWGSCNVTATTDLRVTWAPPANPSCSQYTTTVTVLDAGSGALLLAGPMVLDYSRTWFENNPVTGTPVQVWRYVAKADLSSLVPAGVTPPCPVPSCLPPSGPHPTAFYYGYVDYAVDCAGGTADQNVLVLYHGSDWLQHRAAISSRPGTFHPASSYAIVAPHSTVNPFVPVNTPAIGGPLVAEAVRKTDIPGGLCMTEENLTSGNLQPFVLGCMSPPSLAGTQVTLSIYSGTGTCPDSFGSPSAFAAQALAFPAILPWPYLVTTAIGSWSAIASYPGPEHVWVDEGFFKYYDSCVSNEYYEVFYGGSTDDGWPVIPSTPADPPVQNFKDLVDNYSTPVVGAHPLPLLGEIMKSDHLIYTNVP